MPSTSSTVDVPCDAAPSLLVPMAPDTAITTAVAPATPMIQPAQKARLFTPARLESSIKMMAMMGIGLMATPMAKVMLSPMACPTLTPSF